MVGLRALSVRALSLGYCGDSLTAHVHACSLELRAYSLCILIISSLLHDENYLICG